MCSKGIRRCSWTFSAVFQCGFPTHTADNQFHVLQHILEEDLKRDIKGRWWASMEHWFKHFKDNLERQAQSYITKHDTQKAFFRDEEQACFQRKMQQLRDRGAQVIESNTDEQIINERKVGNEREVDYSVRYKLLIQQKNQLYTEEIIQRRKSLFKNEQLVDDHILDDESHASSPGGGQNVL